MLSAFDQRHQPLTVEEFLPILGEYLYSDSPCPLVVTGNSMAPFLHHRRDVVLLRHPRQRPVKRGEILLVYREDGSLVLHRCKKVESDGTVTLCGDAQCWQETVHIRQVLGVVEAIRRNNGKMISCDSLGYKLPTGLWLSLYRWRPHIFALHRTLKRSPAPRGDEPKPSEAKSPMFHTLRAGDLSATVSRKGGELCSFKLRDTELIWQGDPAYWEGSAPLLFPFCGRVKDGIYRYEGKEYPMPIHGFLPSAKLTVDKAAEDALTLTLRNNPATEAVYPFPFTLSLCYRLTEDSLTLTAAIQAEDTPLLFSFGAHPGFNLPCTPQGFEGARLRFDGSDPLSRIEITSDGLLGSGRNEYPLTENSIPLSPDPAGGCGIFFEIPEKQRTLTLESPALPASIRMEFADFPVLGLWHAEGAPYLCIEPWQGLPAPADQPTDLARKPAAVCLSPHEAKTFTLRICLFQKG